MSDKSNIKPIVWIHVAVIFGTLVDQMQYYVSPYGLNVYVKCYICLL